MRSLFFKIFLWYWLANILVAVAMIFAMWAGIAPGPPRYHIALSNMLTLYGHGAVAVFEHEGPAALRKHLAGIAPPLQFPIFLFDERGNELTAEPAPVSARELASRIAKEAASSVVIPGPSLLLGVQVPGADGRRYVVIGQLPPGPFDQWAAGPHTFALQLVAVIATAGLVCYALSRYLTAPLMRLSAAARDLARGDLTVRAGTKVGNRRDEIGQLGRDFDFMVERIESLMSAQQRLLRDMSHELRSPLARLNIALGLAVQTSGPDAKEALDRIEHEAQRVDELIGELLTLTRLEGSEKVAGGGTIDLAALVLDVVADADFEAKGSGRQVRVLHKDECTVAGTSELLRSAIENVTRNSIRYTPEGSSVDVALRVEQAGAESRAVIRVRDYGPGVPEDSIKNIFRPFYRVGDDRNRQTGGIGLGLAIAQQAVRLHGGSISAANASGGGLIVELSLPLAARDPVPSS